MTDQIAWPQPIRTELTDSDIQEIEDIVMRYQARDPSAAEQLIEHELVWHLILRMVRIMAARARYSGKDPLAYNWVITWADAKERKALKEKSSIEAMHSGQRILVRVNKFLKTTWDESDFMQEVQLAVLELADSYKPQGSSFWSYMLASLPYRIRNRANSIINDGSAHQETNAYIDTPLPTESLRVEGLEEHDPRESWIAGDTSGMAFDRLTKEERFILYEMILEGIKSDDVAAKLGISRSTVFSRKKAAIEKLKESALSLNLIKGDDE